MKEVEKYFCSKKKWKVVIHIAEKCKKLYCTAEGVTTQQSFIVQQKVLLHSRKFYCTTESFISQQNILLHNRKFYRIAEKSVMWQKLEKSSFYGRKRG